MNVREFQLFGLLLFCIFMALASACSPANASEPAQRRAEFLNKEYNRVSDNPVRVRSVKPKAVTSTGYIGTTRVRMRSTTSGKTTTTKGWVNGQYITIQTKKD